MPLHPTSSEYSIHRVSFVDPIGQVNLSPSSHPNSLSKSKSAATASVPAPLITLPPLLFTDRSHFIIKHTTITRSMAAHDESGFASSSTALIGEPITTGIVTITITLLSLPTVDSVSSELFFFGLLDSIAPIPKFGEILDSVCLRSFSGDLCHNTQSSGYDRRMEWCHSYLKEGDRVRMEVDMESTPRTVQFFVNGESGRCFVSGLSQSVRIGV
ncbi:hypothetical protein BLNAU_23927 [Blattamonas nauphoetae]|uniref:SPRY domain-containing protein n=1 Tax=Blattamonas nauphoetae TaxID=2049346 RepID=A0ABQ9WNU8_9EUKA|nr:hypothetical protein BLNAU_23927 [Blattamonas nauphoetae]